jgi:hypothetical protein
MENQYIKMGKIISSKFFTFEEIPQTPDFHSRRFDFDSKRL